MCDLRLSREQFLNDLFTVDRVSDRLSDLSDYRAAPLPY